MSYQVLARKWRPKSFETLIGQSHVVRALTHALEQQRLHHAYLFTGTRGVGKTTIARILAKSLNCETGITAHPCGVCSACVDIDRGRFVDMLEVDAASNTQVDSMRDLLDNAQYAPTVGRFKVYIIDEVHMLSKSAFNAMLKTLEEPPAHVKFILATTDPQKVPVTVLSRCLQFNLRQMSSTSITEHLTAVLAQEGIPTEPTALHLIARAAAGSMRDALSLLDQAIAYGSNSVKELEVRSMLGTIDQSYLFDILNALIATDGASLMAQARVMEQRSLSFEAALNDLAALLHQIAIAQTVPSSLATDLPERVALLDLAQKLSAETIQLYYQIALLGKRDLSLAPDEFAGFTMCLLRMLAFLPEEKVSDVPSRSAPPISASKALASATQANASTNIAPATAIPARAIAETVTSPISEPQTTQSNPPETSNENTPASSASKALNFDGNWRGLVENIKLGLARSLALNCELVRFDDNNILLRVPDAQKHLLEATYQQKLSDAIALYFDKKIKLHFEVGATDNTPAAQIYEEKAEIQSKAVAAIHEDDFVKALINDFGAQIIPSSIKPV